MIYTLNIKNDARVFVVGDLHGMFHILESILENNNFNKEKDILLSVGDLVDRGTYSNLAIDYIKEPWFYSIRGNHEQMLIDYVDGTIDAMMWKGNGGMWSPEPYSYLNFKNIFELLPVLLEVTWKDKKIGLVHAGVPKWISDWEILKSVINDTQIQEKCLWDRSRYYMCDIEMGQAISNIDLVISGHTIVREPLLYKNQLFIDTGGFFLDENFYNINDRNKLTVMELFVENDEIIFEDLQ